MAGRKRPRANASDSRDNYDLLREMIEDQKKARAQSNETLVTLSNGLLAFLNRQQNA